MPTRFPINPWPFELVEIEWKDAMSADTTWDKFDVSTERKLPVIFSVGWQVQETEDAYYLAATVAAGEDEEHRDKLEATGQLFLIPKGMVVDRHVVLPKET
jgi:hypothetical protein